MDLCRDESFRNGILKTSCKFVAEISLSIVTVVIDWTADSVQGTTFIEIVVPSLCSAADVMAHAHY